MLPRFFMSEKLSQLKDNSRTSWKMIKFVWGVDKWLFLATAIAVTIPAIVPFINIYIYKLVIDLVVAIASGAKPFNPAEFYLLIGLRIFTYFLQDTVFKLQAYFERLLWTKVPMHIN